MWNKEAKLLDETPKYLISDCISFSVCDFKPGYIYPESNGLRIQKGKVKSDKSCIDKCGKELKNIKKFASAATMAVTLPSELTFSSPSWRNKYLKNPMLAEIPYFFGKMYKSRNCYCELNAGGKPTQQSTVLKTCLLKKAGEDASKGKINTDHIMEWGELYQS